MQRDERGLTLTTDSPAAAEAMMRATGSYVGWRTDTMAHLDRAIEADPGFALAHAMKGLLLVGLRQPAVHPAARAALAAAQRTAPVASERERRYVAALADALEGHVTGLARHLEAVCLSDPLDIFALRLSQFELFWLGEVGWMRDISERAAPAWSDAVPGYGAYLSVRAFGLEECGDYARAEAAGREAIARDPTDCWAAHAVAHVLIMQGRHGDGAAWCEGLRGNWGGANHIVHHLYWHLSLFHIERGDYDAALDLYDRHIRNPDSPLIQAMPDFYVDIQNGAAFLQRLALRGVDVGARWEALADLAESRIGNHTNPFTSAHCAMVLAAADRNSGALIDSMRDFAARDASALGPRCRLAALPAAEAAIAHHRGEHERVLQVLLPARRSLWQMGGSHAQRDIFFQILADSARRLGRRDVLSILAAELGGIGLERAAERSSYADAFAMIQ